MKKNFLITFILLANHLFAQKNLDSLFLEAVKSNNFEQVKELVEKGADVNTKNKNDWTALHYASRDDKKEIVIFLLKKGADVNVREKDIGGWTPLMLAGYNGNMEIIQLLLDSGAELNAKDKKAYTSLLLALKNKNYETAKLLIEKEADVNARVSEKDDAYPGYTPLHFALENKNYKITKLLIEKGADVNAKDEYNYTPLHFAAKNKNGYETVKLLIEKGANVNAKNKYAYTPLHFATRNENGYETAKLLIEKGADISAKEKHNYTPLHFASWNENGYETAKLLIERGADINAKDEEAYTPLHAAAGNENGYETVKLLIEKGADVNAKDKETFTPLHSAAENKNGYEIAKLLIEKGADVNVKNEAAYTPLHFAAGNENGYQTAKLLIEKIVNINAKVSERDQEYSGYTPLYFALENKNYKITKLLIEKGADINAKFSENNEDYPGYTPLLFALDNENYEIAKLLIEKGADVNTKVFEKDDDYPGYTPLHFAAKQNNIVTSYLLIKNGANINAKNKNGLTAKETAKNFSAFEVYNLLNEPDKYIIFALYQLPDYKTLFSTLKKEPQLYQLQNSSGLTLLHLSIKDNNETLFKKLIKNKKILNLKNKTSETALLYALIINKPAYAEKLILAGADVNTADNKGFTPLYIAKSKGYKNIEKLLIKKSANLKNPDPKLILPTNSYSTSFIAISPIGKSFISGSTSDIKLWDIANGNKIKIFYRDMIVEFINSIAFSPDGKTFILASNDTTIKLCDIATGKEIKTFEEHRLTSFAFSPDGKTFISGTGGVYRIGNTIKLWNVATGEKLKDFNGHLLTVFSVAFNPSRKTFISGSGDGTVKLWDIATGKEIKTFKVNVGTVHSVAFSPNGKTFISAGNSKTVRLWDIDTGKEIKTFYGHRGEVHSVAFSPDGKTFISGSWDNTVKLWDIATGNVIYTFRGHTDRVSSVSFSPDGKFILSGSWDNTTKLWSPETGKELATLVAIDSTDWAVTTPSGLFDASPGAMKLMHYTVGVEIVELEQLKDRFYEPGLLQKIIKGEKLRNVQGFNNIKLPPHIKLLPIQNGKLNIQIENVMEGGIGRVPVYINGKEIIADARTQTFERPQDFKASSQKEEINLTIDLNQYQRYFLLGKPNIISVKAYNGENYIISRPAITEYMPALPTGIEADKIPDVYIVSIGVSDYQNDVLDLRFAAKDAQDMATALQIAAKGLFGSPKVHTYLVTLPLAKMEDAQSIPASRDSINRLFYHISKKIQAKDILIVYMVGHGISIDPNDDGGDFYYLTADAFSADEFAYFDETIRNKTTISGEGLVRMLTNLPANKQVLIIDACHSGKAVENLAVSRDISSGTIRALERMKDRTGMHIITGSTADAVSYESNRFGQGILTYSLLEGIKGAALKNGKFVDVLQLFYNAKERVPELAKGLGGIQQPVIFSPYIAGKYEEGASSFEIGELNEQAKAKVPLAKSKPMFVRSAFQDAETFDDHIELGAKMDEKLQELTDKGRHAPLILIDTRSFPDAYKIRGQYTISGNTANLKAKLFLNKEAVKTFSLSAEKDKADELIKNLTYQILEYLKKQ